MSATRSPCCNRDRREAGTYREASQENFLVLAGECLLVIEGEERSLKRWDFVHCPPNTEHGFVGAGSGPCVIFMVGARQGWPEKGLFYPRSEPALRHDMGVEKDTAVPAEAYAASLSASPGARAAGPAFPGPRGRAPTAPHFVALSHKPRATAIRQRVERGRSE